MVDALIRGKPITKLIKPEASEPKQRTVRRKRAIIELIDMYTTPIDITLSEPFAKVTRLIVFQAWDGTTVDYSLFNDGAAGADALPNGIQIEIDSRPLFPQPIKAQEDYMRYAFDTDVVVDTKGLTKRTFFTSRLSFWKITGDSGGVDLVDYDLVVKIQDAISSFGTNGAVTWAFEGWGWDR